MARNVARAAGGRRGCSWPAAPSTARALAPSMEPAPGSSCKQASCSSFPRCDRGQSPPWPNGAMSMLLLFVGGIAATAAPRADLGATLSGGIFYHNGTARKTDEYTYINMKVSYNEPDNVTCVGCGWHVGNGGWTYLWQKTPGSPPPPPPPACSPKVIATDKDVNGGDLGSVIVKDIESCGKACCAESRCAGALFEPQSAVTFGHCVAGKPCCFLKSSLASRKPLAKTHGSLIECRKSNGPAADTPVVPPPMGLRSAPALGGVSAGSTELRSDGSFRDWTILNQGPAGSGKYGNVDDVFMAARVGVSPAMHKYAVFLSIFVLASSAVVCATRVLTRLSAAALQTGPAKVLRTHPPSYAKAQAVDALTFSGSYPLTRLTIEDEALRRGGEAGGAAAAAAAAGTGTAAAGTGGVELSVFGYSTLKPGSLAESAYPALALTLKVVNHGAAATTADFMFTLPFGGWTACSRKGANGTKAAGQTTYTECMHACTVVAGCASWEFTDKQCTLNPDVPMTAHAVGSYCGVRGDGWKEANGAVGWSQRPVAVGPSIGDITLKAVGGSVSYGASDDPKALLSQFSGSGKFTSAPGAAGVLAAHGAAAASTSVGPGETKTISIVFAWYFPDRNYKYGGDKAAGDGLILGNMYAELWPSSAAVATALATEAKLASVVADINAHHAAVAHPANPTPVWLKDQLLNQFSHFHM
eukprot:SAG22_NODE_75_length_22256_cov_45.062960_12_plen_700_part_00